MAIKVIVKNIYVDRFDCGVDIKFVAKNTDDTPYDLTGYEVQFIIKQRKDDSDELAIENKILSDFVDNVITIPIDKKLSSNPVGTYHYAMRLFNNGNFVNTIIQAEFNIVNNTFENEV